MFAIAANAQMSAQYRAEVPFDFEANGTSYNVGGFQVGPMTTYSSVGPLVLIEKRSGRKQIIGNTVLGGDATKGQGKLLFIKTNGIYRLVQVETPTFQLKLRLKTESVRVAMAEGKQDFVAIDLFQR